MSSRERKDVPPFSPAYQGRVRVKRNGGGRLSSYSKRSLLFVAYSVVWMQLSLLTAESTTVEKLSLEELTRRSRKIVVGRCLSTASRWNEKHTLILTFSKFAVSEDLKGRSHGSVTVMTVGGTVDGITQTVSGSPHFFPNEEAILFLEATKSSHWQPVGLSQGKFLIVKDPRGSEKEVMHNLNGLELYDTSAKALSVQPKSFRAPLETFLSRLRKLIQEQK